MSNFFDLCCIESNSSDARQQRRLGNKISKGIDDQIKEERERLGSEVKLLLLGKLSYQ